MKRGPSSPIDTDFEKRANLNTSGSSLEGENMSEIPASPDMEALFKQFTDKVIQTLKDEISALRVDLAKKDTIIDNLQKENQSIQARVNKIESRNDDLEQYSRRNSVRVSGIPENDEENTDNIILNISDAIGANLNERDICRSHRVGDKSKGPRSIIVKFVSYNAKQKLMIKRKDLGTTPAEELFPNADWLSDDISISVNDDLTKRRAILAFEARKAKRAEKIKDTWVSNGKIMVKLNNDDRKVIRTKEDLDELTSL